MSAALNAIRCGDLVLPWICFSYLPDSRCLGIQCLHESFKYEVLSLSSLIIPLIPTFLPPLASPLSLLFYHTSTSLILAVEHALGCSPLPLASSLKESGSMVLVSDHDDMVGALQFTQHAEVNELSLIKLLLSIPCRFPTSFPMLQCHVVSIPCQYLTAIKSIITTPTFATRVIQLLCSKGYGTPSSLGRAARLVLLAMMLLRYQPH
ncbi:hypothetical protein EDD85DRAFT_955564 [Armillaria nabsnona]|nr:hypothetical protein EDD85DRAFT_955564 [Armillaria nabsnona]